MEKCKEVNIIGKGQTSDGREITLVEKKYFDLPADFPEVPAGYEEWKGSKTVDNLSDFLTVADYAFVVRQMQYKQQREMRLFYKKFDLYFIFPGRDGKIDILFYNPIVSCLYMYPEEFLSIPYTEFRRIVLSWFGVYDFVNETEIPKGVSGSFGAAVKALDEAYDEVRGNFLKISALLTSIVANTADLKLFGCKDIFEFAEKRWGYGSTSVKNFLAIAEKFMSGQELLPAAEGYGYSQLVELSSVPEAALSEFNSKMTIQEIRKKKKEVLEGDSSKEEKEKAHKKEKEIDVFKTSIRAFFCGFKIPYTDPASSGYKVYRKALREVVQKLNSEFGLGISTNF